MLCMNCIHIYMFIMQAGLMQKQNRDGKLRITDKGYEFMLRDIHVQAWMFVLALIRSYGM
jgi:predicted transcriptional regulator